MLNAPCSGCIHYIILVLADWWIEIIEVDEEIAALRGQDLSIVDVAEVENLFCVPAALKAAAAQLKLGDGQAAIQAAQMRVVSELKKSLNIQIAARAIAEIQFQLQGFGPKPGRVDDPLTLQTLLSEHMAKIDVGKISARCAQLFNGIVASEDYEAALRFYNCKGVTSFVASAFGMKSHAYCTMIRGLGSFGTETYAKK